VSLLVRFLEGRSRPQALALSLALLLAIAGLDLLWARGLSLSILYVLPILLASWFAGSWAALLLSVAGALFWFTTDLTRGDAAAGLLSNRAA
jgi:hypothetical protein